MASRPFLVAVASLLLLGCGSAGEPLDPTTTTSGAGGSASGLPSDAGAVLLCPAGEVQLDDGSCLAPGIETCAEGFTSDGTRGCDAVLPASPCAGGFMAVPGDEACRPVAACGSGPYDGIPVEPNTQHVNPAFTGAVSDGSAAMPHKTLAEGIAAAEDGAIVALGPGTYPATVLDRPLKLWASCPDAVSVVGGDEVGLRITVNGAEVHRIAISASAGGVVVTGAETVLLEELHVHDTTGPGIRVRDGSEATIRGTLVDGTAGKGVDVQGANATLEATEVRDPLVAGTAAIGVDVNHAGSAAALQVVGSRVHGTTGYGIRSNAGHVTIEGSVVADTAATTSNAGGVGLWLRDLDDLGLPGSLVLRDSVIERHNDHGVVVYAGELQAERLTVRDVFGNPVAPSNGRCMRILPQDGVTPSVSVSHSVIQGCRDAGLWAGAADMTVEASIIRDVAANVVAFDEGMGLLAEIEAGVPSKLTVRGLLVERTELFGVWVKASDATLDGVLVREPSVGLLGIGLGVLISIDSDGATSSASVRQTVIESPVGAGLAVLGSEVEVEHLVVRDAQESPLQGFGDGVVVSGVDPAVTMLTAPAAVDLSFITIERAQRAGLASFAAPVTVDHGLFECNVIDLNAENIEEAPDAILVDAGDNVCGCEGEQALCKVQSSGLAPPVFLP